MALNELNALESAYHALQPLSGSARRRALQWLSAALDDGTPLPDSAFEADAPQTQVAVAATKQKPATRRRAMATTRSVVAKKTKGAKPSSAAAKPSSAAAKSLPRRRRAGQREAAAAGGQRMYRRMPEADVVMNAYEEVGTVSGLAEHFDVPLHTVNHWARQLRKQGYNIGRSR